MAVVAADYTTVVTLCRDALAKGTSLFGKDLVKVIDVVQDAANTLDSKGVAATVALEALLVTHLDTNWVAVGTGDSAAVRTAALAALATPRTAAVAAAAASITNVTASDALDGRPAA